MPTQPDDEVISRTVQDSNEVMMPKTDGHGRIYREVRCPHCRAFLLDEFIRKGRIRIKCFKCGKITLMDFRPLRSRRKIPDPKQLKSEES